MPTDSPAADDDIEARGEMTAATARQANLPAEIGILTGLSELVVRQRLDEANGNRRVWTVFAHEWPDLSRIASDVEFETSGAARVDKERIATIAKVTGLSQAVVQIRLESTASEARVGQVFAPEWPPDDSDENQDVRSLGRLRTSDARMENRARLIARDTGLTEVVVRARLESAPGRTLVRNVFRAEWPRRSEPRDSTAKRHGGRPPKATHPACPPDPVTGTAALEPLGQGGTVHRTLQDAIANLGVLKGYHVETDKPLTAGFRPDVAWFKVDGNGNPKPSPYHVFEIERGSHGARAKSIQSLQHAHENFNATVTLLVHEPSFEAVREMLPGQLSAHVKLRSIEACLARVHRLVELARVLEVELGTRR